MDTGIEFRNDKTGKAWILHFVQNDKVKGMDTGIEFRYDKTGKAWILHFVQNDKVKGMDTGIEFPNDGGRWIPELPIPQYNGGTSSGMTEGMDSSLRSE